jgi:hypothetical protein
MLGNLRFTEPDRCLRTTFAAIGHINQTGIRRASPGLTQSHIVTVSKISFVY